MAQKRFGWFIVPAFPLALGGYALSQQAESPRVGEAVALLATMTARVDAPDLSQAMVEAFGGHRAISRPSKDAVMGFPQPTMIREIAVRAGQAVKAGDLMIRGDDTEDEARYRLQKIRAETQLPVESERAKMDLAKVEYERLREAEARNASGKSEVERARLSAEVSEINWRLSQNQQESELVALEVAKARLDRLRLAAPFEGVVDQVMADPGRSVSESDRIIRVVQVDPLWIDVPTPTSDPMSITVREGDPAWVLIDTGGKAIRTRGRVVEVSPTAEPASRTRRVRVEVPNPVREDGSRLLSGEPAWVRFSPPADAGGEGTGHAGNQTAEARTGE